MQKIKKVLFADIAEDGTMIKEELLPSPIPVIRNHYNSKYFQKKGEVNEEPSLTIPDQSYTVQELLARFASGLPMSGQKIPMYDGEEETNDLEKLELSERMAIIRSAQEEIVEINERVKKRQMEAQEAKMQAKIEARLQEKENKRAQYEELKKEFENET